MKVLIKILRRKDFVFLQTLGLLFLIAANAITLFFPVVLSKIMDDFFATQAMNSSWLIVAASMGVTSVIIVFFQNYIYSYLSEKVAYIFRQRLMKKITFQPERFFLKHQPSQVLTVLTSDVNFVKDVFGRAISMSLATVMLILGSGIFMFALNFQLAIIILSVVVIVVAFMFTILSSIKALFKESRRVRDLFNRIINENVMGSMLIRVFIAEKFEIKKFRQINTETYDLGKKIIEKVAFILPSMNFVSLLASVIILQVGGSLVIRNQMTLGEITVFINYVMMFTMSLLMVGMMSALIGQAMVSLERITKIITSSSDFPNGLKKLRKLESLEFKNVCLEIQEKEILKNIDLKLEAGKQVALVGVVGSGKTLLLQLMTRLIEPTSGEILINGKTIGQFDIESLRQKVGFAFQENFLLDDTIAANIDFGRQLTKSQLQLAMKIAQVTEFVNKFEKGDQYLVGEAGRKLSGGQKQRVNIARAVAGKPDLVILDDVTSNLDAETEKNIIDNVALHLTQPAVCVVSQKIASIRDCDQIYVLENGIITAQGTHDQLLNTSVFYQEMELTQRNYGKVE